MDMALNQAAMAAGARSALLMMRAASLRHVEAGRQLEEAQEKRLVDERSLRTAVQETGRQRLGEPASQNHRSCDETGSCNAGLIALTPVSCTFASLSQLWAAARGSPGEMSGGQAQSAYSCPGDWPPVPW